MTTLTEPPAESFGETPDEKLAQLLSDHVLEAMDDRSPQSELLREAIKRLKEDRLALILEQVDSYDGRWDDAFAEIERLARGGRS